MTTTPSPSQQREWDLRKRERDLERRERSLTDREAVLAAQQPQEVPPDDDPLAALTEVTERINLRNHGVVRRCQRIGPATFIYHVQWTGGKKGSYRRRELLRRMEAEAILASLPPEPLPDAAPADTPITVGSPVYYQRALGRVTRVHADRHTPELGMVYSVSFGSKKGTFRRKDLTPKMVR